MTDIVWRGDEYSFTEEQLTKVKLILTSVPVRIRDPDGRCRMDGRNRYRSHMMLEIFILNLKELISQGYVIHHIDGDPTNDHPSNLMVMTRSAHSSMHTSERFEKFSEDEWEAFRKERHEIHANKSVEEKAEWDNAIKEGQDKRSTEEKDEWRSKISESNKKTYSEKSPEEKLMHSKIRSKAARAAGLADCSIRGEQFLKDWQGPFTVKDFNEIVQYSSATAARMFLSAQIREGNISIDGKGPYGVNIYLAQRKNND